MKMKLEYVVDREEYYNEKTRKWANRIVSKSYCFQVEETKTKQEHNSIIDDFENVLIKNGIDYEVCFDGAYMYYLDIEVCDTEDKKEIEKLFKLFKKSVDIKK